LIGWYGHGNAGDERILYCLKDCMRGAELVVVSGLHDVAVRRAELESCDFVLFGGGGLVLRGFGKYAQAIRDLRVRFACVGIGVDAVHADNYELIRTLLDKSEFILVRDEQSWEALARNPKVLVGPDLTFLRPLPVSDPPDDNRCGINLRPWPYWLWEHNSLPDKVMRRLNRRAPWLSRAYPLPMWEPARCVQVLRSIFSELVPISLYEEAGVPGDADVLRRFVHAAVAADGMQQVGRQPYLCGMRLHSLVFACQTGTPFISLSYLPKNAAFCASVGMERFSVRLGDLRALNVAATELLRSRVSVREHLLDVRARNVATIGRLMDDIRSRVLGKWSGECVSR
jgi:polysaccharide pyruvyl transferase WcaK-like protein